MMIVRWKDLRVRMGYDEAYYVNPYGLSARLALRWKGNSQINII